MGQGHTVCKTLLYSILFCIAISPVGIYSFHYYWSFHSVNQSTLEVRLPGARNQRKGSEQIERINPLATELTSTASQPENSSGVSKMDQQWRTKQIRSCKQRHQLKWTLKPLNRNRELLSSHSFSTRFIRTSLPAPYGICLYSLLRNHRFRDGRRERNAGEFDYYFWTDQSIKEYREDGVQQKEFGNFNSANETGLGYVTILLPLRVRRYLLRPRHGTSQPIPATAGTRLPLHLI